MPRARDLAAAAGFAIVVIVGAVFVAEIRSAIAAAFPGHARTIIGGSVIMMIGAAIAIAVRRIRAPWRRGDAADAVPDPRAGHPVQERRALRYLALAAALVAGALFARGLSTGDADTDVVESFHFVEYGLLTVLFYRAWRPLGDLSVFVLPVLAGVLVGTLDEWLQWFVPSRVGEIHDVVLDGVAVACGLLFGIAFSPPPQCTLALRRGSAMRIGWTAIVVTVVLALFFQTVHLGYDVHDPAIGTFRSRYSRGQLESVAKERAGRWRGQPPTPGGRLSREDQFVSEGLWHVRHRNQAMAGGDVLTAWRENRILETFYAPLLDTGTYQSPAGFAWPAEQRVQAARAAASDGRPYVSEAAPMPIYTWPKRAFWMVIALATGTILAIGMSAGKREQPWP